MSPTPQLFLTIWTFKMGLHFMGLSWFIIVQCYCTTGEPGRIAIKIANLYMFFVGCSHLDLQKSSSWSTKYVHSRWFPLKSGTAQQLHIFVESICGKPNYIPSPIPPKISISHPQMVDVWCLPILTGEGMWEWNDGLPSIIPPFPTTKQ